MVDVYDEETLQSTIESSTKHHFGFNMADVYRNMDRDNSLIGFYNSEEGDCYKESTGFCLFIILYFCLAFFSLFFLNEIPFVDSQLIFILNCVCFF